MSRYDFRLTSALCVASVPITEFKTQKKHVLVVLRAKVTCIKPFELTYYLRN